MTHITHDTAGLLTLLTKPMKGPSEPLTPAQFSTLRYPVHVTPKLDGIRATVQGGRLLSNTLKPIPNEYCQSIFTHELVAGFDGELIVGDPTALDCMQRTSSGVMSKTGRPDVWFYVFDTLHPLHLYKSYTERLRVLESSEELCNNTGRMILLTGKLCETPEELAQYCEFLVVSGYEGAILRPTPDRGYYKSGRCTAREGYIFKFKPYHDREATLVGMEELLLNSNESTMREDGYQRKSSAQAGQIPAGTLGALILQDEQYGIFRCGSGFSMAQRKWFWQNRHLLTGRATITYKFQLHGTKDKPRSPIYKAIRHELDIS